ncbi:hypothetical protein MTR67_017615 [Solanum verrucosum]|uniref:Uncharacterized protein n=1 Tax=Solanum verrucosum TaxID=315347 RepID=A0AAF0QKU1_SOLVR|nr:hypothetical protein MTR67_017615 [Solanum verrucosum]
MFVIYCDASRIGVMMCPYEKWESHCLCLKKT